VLLDFLFPNYKCFACGCELNAGENIYLCDNCAKDLPINTEPVVLVNPDAKQHFNKAYAAFRYQEPISKMILGLKYNDRAQVATAVAPYMAAALIKGRECPLSALVPVPLCKKRQRERGYNQAELLANEMAKTLGLVVEKNVLLRTKVTTPQKKMTVAVREENLRGAFAVADGADVKGRNFIIVDDVFTSGTTVNECAQALKKCGATKVDVVVIARA
jgi:ComF family protein